MRRRTFLLRLTQGAAAFALLARARRAAADASVNSGSISGAAADSSAVHDAIEPGSGSTEPVALLAAAGDTTLGFNLQDHFDQQLEAGLSRDLLVSLYFANVRPILQWADLTLVNLECPFTDRGQPLPKNFNFRARPDLVEILTRGGVGAVTLANNHLADYGPEGIDDTISTLDRAGIAHFGAGRDLAAARAPLVLERAGVRLGFLGYYFQGEQDMREPRAVYAADGIPGVAGCYTDLACMRDMLERDLSQLVPRVDAAIPFFHWGHEGSTEVREYQIELAHRAIDLGARAVLGAHPHRLQGIELYRGAPVLYSLGNFVFGGNKDPQDKRSAIARLRVPRRGPVEVSLIPIQVTRWPEAPFQPIVLEAGEREAALDWIADLSRGFAETIPELRGRASALPPPATRPEARYEHNWQ